MLLGVGAAFKEFTIQSEEMKLNLHWPFKGMIHKKKSERERDHCRKGAMDLGGIANGMAGGGGGGGGWFSKEEYRHYQVSKVSFNSLLYQIQCKHLREQ